MRRVLVLSKEGCNPCDRVKRILHEMRANGAPIEIEEIDMTSDAGVRLALQHNILYPPAVFVDGAFFAYGKIREADLARAVEVGGV